MAATATTELVVRDLPVSDIMPTPDNPREIDEESPSFVELLNSVKASGVLVPGHVRPHPTLKGKWDLRCGARRHHASILAGRLTMPCVVHETCSDAEAFEITFLENFARQDLTPLEEGEAVRILLDRFQGDHAAAADKLGKTRNWVCLRERLGQLSPAWRKAARDDKAPFARWGAPQLALIARLDADLQDVVLATLKHACRYESERFAATAAMSAAALDKWLNDEYLHLLKGAPWGLDDATLDPTAGACADCTKRSSCQGNLFLDADLADGKAAKLDRCLDAKCWDRKATARLRRRYAELKAEHKELPILMGEGNWDRVEATAQALAGKGGQLAHASNYQRAKKDEKGAFVAFLVDGKGNGELRWYKRQSYDTGSSRRDSTPKPTKTLAERREELHHRRGRLGAKKLLAAARATSLPDHQVMAFAVAFGTDGNAGYYHHTDPWQPLEEASKALPEATRLALWTRVCNVLGSRLEAFEREPKRLLGEVASLAAALGYQWRLYFDEACAEIREPRTWKNLNADGTPKSATDKKPKRKKAKATEPPETPAAESEPSKKSRKRAAKAAAERACRICGCTEANACADPHRGGEPCCWVEDDLCSACIEKGIEGLVNLKNTTLDKKKTTNLEKRIARLHAVLDRLGIAVRMGRQRGREEATEPTAN
ncbi:MAG TPA: ParB/RepB/Spo0J family partition protein [Planctomycetota bacterium]|nr:ParB/RepB/Spo0J family partition protein [Planctomycetota bacterium]